MDGPHPKTILGLLADDTRLRVVAALALGADRIGPICEMTGLAAATVSGALERLVGAGLVERTPAGPTRHGGALRLVPSLFAQGAREAARLRNGTTPEELGATPEQATIIRNFLDEHGRLRHIPTTRAKRLPILDFLSQRFEPGKVYPERDVNFELGKLHRDTAALRRYLVDEGYLERRDGFYWRAGGTCNV